MKRFLLAIAVLAFAFTILLISIFNSSSIDYSFYIETVRATNGNVIPNPPGKPLYIGKVLPDSPLWGLKELRDQIWFGITPTHLRRAELALLFADKRVLMSEDLFKQGKTDIALSTFIKGEKYLEIAANEESKARGGGVDTDKFLNKFALSIMKHQEIIESLIHLAPEETKRVILENKEYSVNAYNSVRDALNYRNLPIPKNPFVGE